MPKIGLIVILVIFFAAGCGSPVSNEPPSGSNPKDVSKAGGAAADGAPADAGRMSATAACYAVDAGKKVVLRSQTFPIDFEPFRNSCFVTSHDPRFQDPPLESEIAIYKNGKRVFDFPDQFNGVTVGCWVEAVAFQDVNDDNLTDIVMVGKCSAKSAPYNENMVYFNNGKSFVTRQDVNNRLSDFKTIKEIVGYVKENADALSPNASANSSKS